MDKTSIPSGSAPARVSPDPKAVAALQVKVTRLVGIGALTAAPHSYHH